MTRLSWRASTRRRAEAASWAHLRRRDPDRRTALARLARLEGAVGLLSGVAAMALSCPLYVRGEVSTLGALLLVPSLFLLWRLSAAWRALLLSGLRPAHRSTPRVGAQAAAERVVLRRGLGWIVAIAAFSLLPAHWLWAQFALATLAAAAGAYILARSGRAPPNPPMRTLESRAAAPPASAHELPSAPPEAAQLGRAGALGQPAGGRS